MGKSLDLATENLPSRPLLPEFNTITTQIFVNKIVNRVKVTFNYPVYYFLRHSDVLIVEKTVLNP